MPDHQYHSEGRPATPGQHMEVAAPAAEPLYGPTTFPVFATPPFFAWQNLHRRHERFQSLHPSCQPLILLWDEVNDPGLFWSRPTA